MARKPELSITLKFSYTPNPMPRQLVKMEKRTKMGSLTSVESARLPFSARHPLNLPLHSSTVA